MYEVNGFQGVSIWSELRRVESIAPSIADRSTVPPNTDVGNPWTMLPAGLLSMLWGLGVRGVAVR